MGPKQPPKRKYEPIWDKLKEKQKVVVQVHRLIVSRVTKAVIKEKNNDVSFKMANDKDKLRLSIQCIKLADNKHVRIEFVMKQRFGLVDIQKEIDLGQPAEVMEIGD